MSASQPKLTVKCKVSPSLLPNNLQANEDYLYFIHRNEVHGVKLTSDTFNPFVEPRISSAKTAYDEKDPVSSVIAPKGMMFLCTLGGFVGFYSDGGAKLLDSHRLTQSQVGLNPEDMCLRGLGYDVARSNLFVGCGSGEILVFHVSLSEEEEVTTMKMKLTTKLRAHSSPITAVAVREDLLVTCDELGQLRYWKLRGSGSSSADFVAVTIFDHPGDICWTVAIGHGYVAAGFTSGYLRYYHIDKKDMTVEIAAHSRMINAVDMHPTKPAVLSVAEDACANYWSLPTEQESKVKSLVSYSPSPSLLTGACFVRLSEDEGQAPLAAVAAYDCRSLFAKTL